MDWTSIYREFVVAEAPSSTMKKFHGGHNTQTMNGQQNLKVEFVGISIMCESTLLKIDGCTQKYMDSYI